MALLQSVIKAQIPLGCQLCDSGTKICWKCINCSLLLCRQCKEIHLTVNNSNNHIIIDIKEVRSQDESGAKITFEMNCPVHIDKTCVLYCKTCEQFICIKCVTKVHKGHDAVDEEEYKAELHKLLEIQKDTEIKLKKLALNKAAPGSLELEAPESREPNIKVSRQYTTDLDFIANMLYCSSKSLWIIDLTNDIMKRVRLKKGNTHILSEYRIVVNDMTINSNNDIILSVSDESKLKLFDETTRQIRDTQYNVTPFFTYGVHVTKDHRVIIGVSAAKTLYIEEGRRLVIVMNEEGHRIKQFEHDRNKMPLFTAPVRITSTSNGNICVLDSVDHIGRSRVIVLGPKNNIIQIYTGHPDIDSRNRPFKCYSILATPADNIIATDRDNNTLHILNCDGVSKTYFRTDDLGIRGPFSLALSKPGQLYIGCAIKLGSPASVKAALYRLKYSGF